MFEKPAVDFFCPLCRLAFDFRRSRSRNPLQQQWASCRSVSSRVPKPSMPSRLVLSEDVARTKRAENMEQNGERETIYGPFPGMNRRVANIDPKPRMAQARLGGRDDRGQRANEDHGEKPYFKALRMQSALKSIGYGQRNATKERLEEMDTFDCFDLMPSIKDALTKDMFANRAELAPTPVQKLAIPALLGKDLYGDRLSTGDSRPEPVRREFLLAAETGSGKTLAYLLPCVNSIKADEAQDPSIVSYKERLEEEQILLANPKFKGKTATEPHPTCARPRAIILAPTAELVGQIGTVAKKLSHTVKFKVEKISAEFAPKIIQRRLYRHEGVDMVVATPHILASMADSDPYILSRVSHLVIDEADSLLDRTFAPLAISVMERAMPSLKQLILCSATIPKGLDNYLLDHFPDMKRIVTPNLHAIPRRVQLGVVDASKEPYHNNKDLACADAIWSIGKGATLKEGPLAGEVDVRRIIVFVNEREKTQEIANYLVSQGIDAVALHRDTPEQRQSDMLASFTNPVPMKTQTDEAEDSSTNGRRHLSNTKVIVATDLASRGIDTVGVRYVILYDVPRSTIDFIHRLGRVGRKGTRAGRGIVLVDKDDRRDVVAEVKESMFMGQALI